MLRLLIESSILLVASAVATLATFWLHPYAPSLYVQMDPLREDEVTLDIIEERWGGNVQWVDARISEQFETAHIPGAVSLNEQHYDEQLFDLFETFQSLDRPIVIYCNSEACKASRTIADKLGVLPLEIYILKRGWPAWRKANSP